MDASLLEALNISVKEHKEQLEPFMEWALNYLSDRLEVNFDTDGFPTSAELSDADPAVMISRYPKLSELDPRLIVFITAITVGDFSTRNGDTFIRQVINKKIEDGSLILPEE